MSHIVVFDEVVLCKVYSRKYCLNVRNIHVLCMKIMGLGL